tara:strand:+ start:233 stop:490 length:258 start_codon:yes stop_codon:yes gene_type:complete
MNEQKDAQSLNATKKNVFEFVKFEHVTKDGIQVSYFTRKNGELITDSLSVDKEKAKKFFNDVVAINGETKKFTVLKTIKKEGNNG